MRRMLTALAAAISVSLLVCGVAAASITLFEPPLFHLGSVNGQSGVGGFPWKSSPPGAIDCLGWPVGTPTHTGQYDQEVVANSVAPPGEPPGFGSQSLRMSNACASGEFFYQTYSPMELVQVGERRLRKVFIAQFSFMSGTAAYQPGLFLSVSPDSHEGSRMSWVGLEDTSAGIRVSAADTPEVDGEFVNYPGLALLDRTHPHTIRFRIKVNPGPDNDVVRIAIDARDVGQCFTTWENYYRTAPEQAPPPNANTPADINSLQFRSSVLGPPDLAISGGYLFDNVSITPSSGPGPKACSGGGEGPLPPIDIDKQTQARSALPGDLITYRITVRNRGDAPVRNARACDRAPRALRFFSASRRLHRAAGRRLCLTIRLLRPHQHKTFRATFAVRASVPAGTVTNGASVDVPTASAPSPVLPENAVIPTRRRRQVDGDAARVRVRPAAEGPCGAAALNRDAHAAC